jgi:hypothetical protein
MRHKNLIQIPFKSASQTIYIMMCSVCYPSNFFNIGLSPCCWKPAALSVVVQNWSCLAKFLDEVRNYVPIRSNFDAKLYLKRSSDLFGAFRWSNVLFDDFGALYIIHIYVYTEQFKKKVTLSHVYNEVTGEPTITRYATVVRKTKSLFGIDTRKCFGRCSQGRPCCKITTPQQKAFCILQFAKTNFITTVQRLFLSRFEIDPPARKTI